VLARIPITLRLSALVVLIVVATALMLNQLYLRGSSQILTEQAIGELQNQARSFSYPLAADIDQLQNDTRLLANLESSKTYVRSGRDDPLTVAFTQMLATHPNYTKIRVIGVADNGKELLKVARDGNRIVRSPASELAQHESERFFREALQAAPGQIALSDGELYRENGKIVTPHLLVLRASAPLYSTGGKLFGIVVINMDLGRVLAKIGRNLGGHAIYVTNGQGDYLANPDPAKLFATDLGTGSRIQADNPALPEALAASPNGDVTLLPKNTGRDYVLAFRKLAYDPLDPDRYLGISARESEAAIVARAIEYRNYGLLVSLGIVLIAAFAAVFLLRVSLRPLRNIADAVTRYREGEAEIGLPEQSPDEIGLLAREFRAMIVQKTDEDWVREGLVATTRKLLGFRSLNAFAESLMQMLTATVGAEVGVLYLASSFTRRGTAQEETLTLAGSSGQLGDDGPPLAIRLGEGLVGQCAKDREPRAIRDIPYGYLTIATALAQAKPREILLLPIVFEDRLVGVIELASLTGFSPIQREFLERVSYHIGISVNSISSRMHTEELLEESRQQAEELQRSEEELKTQQEELEASNEEMEERARELEALNLRIRESGERLGAVVDSSIDGIVSIDEAGTIQSINPACERLFGYRPDELVGQNVKVLMPEPYHGEHDGYLARYHETGVPHIIGTSGREVEGLRKDGTTFPIDLSVSAFMLGGRRYYSGTIRDITARKEAEARMEQASRYKSEFLANMSHELRTPLNSLLILARNLSLNEDGNLTGEQVEEAQVIYNGGLELLSLINDILDLSKVEAGKLNFAAEDVPVVGIAKRIERQFQPIAAETGVAFEVELDPNLPATIHSDPQRLEQILKNLLSNAFKFTERGKVTLRVGVPGDEAELHRTTRDHGGTVAFSVSDTGIGIDQAKLADIFEAFQQEDGSIDRHYGGTGLGLTIARKFAHMLGGEIHVESSKGIGSTFTLMLPLQWEPKAAEDAPLPPPARPMPPRTELAPPRQPAPAFIPDDRDLIGEGDKVALIVEDDANFSRTLMKIARGHGYKCLAAGDGKSGIMLALEWPVSAVILDLTLPDIDGMAVLDQLKSNLKTRHVPVHIVTGRGKDEDVAHLRKGAIGYLTKPVQFEEIDRAFGKIESLLQAKLQKILVIEDDRKTQAAIRSLLKKKSVEIVGVGTGAAGLEQVRSEAYDCVILDLTLPDMSGFEWLEAFGKQAGDAEPPPVIVYTAKDLTEEEDRKLNQYTGSIVIKGASSAERLLDEVTLFLHSVEATLTKDQQTMIRMQHDPDKVLHARKVLLVDDDMRNTFALSKLLKKHGMDVVIADNGQMALDRLAEEPGIELVIMDIMMPVMDGYQAIQAIRARSDLAGLPVIALTARAMPEEQERCIAAGANDYLVKPVDVERLLTLLRVWLFRQDEAA
jgi:PAS domain S-box-containing protein